ncbi:hypothetical protein CSB93_5933 [Pseudomonas paraeruginosa]|uniref:Uncharacterized protein n=1 Tax=Pseudomonas paraeruginosa TaxID=2994495 RepID=A0A2R3J3T9_9PSED|nr:hypothetical protein CSB93_5933 [Pseudomonas paraeruginosa]AWE90744.1 hypothetical protein CSC28_4732 [Pseudomonas paraeruginosa]
MAVIGVGGLQNVCERYKWPSLRYFGLPWCDARHNIHLPLPGKD